jgi:hypothetical protein
LTIVKFDRGRRPSSRAGRPSIYVYISAMSSVLAYHIYLHIEFRAVQSLKRDRRQMPCFKSFPRLPLPVRPFKRERCAPSLRSSAGRLRSSGFLRPRQARASRGLTPRSAGFKPRDIRASCTHGPLGSRSGSVRGAHSAATPPGGRPRERGVRPHKTRLTRPSARKSCAWARTGRLGRSLDSLVLAWAPTRPRWARSGRVGAPVPLPEAHQPSVQIKSNDARPARRLHPNLTIVKFERRSFASARRSWIAARKFDDRQICRPLLAVPAIGAAR